MGGGNSSSPDPQIGKAALKNAALGRDYLSWTKDRAKTTDAWAAEDRARSKTVFQPLENRFISEAKTVDSAPKVQEGRMSAMADVGIATKAAQDVLDRKLAADGVAPGSRRGIFTSRAAGIGTTLAKLGAADTAEAALKAKGEAMRANAINMGRGLAVNPLSSFTAGTGAVGGGVQTAQQGNRDVIGAFTEMDRTKAMDRASDASGMESLMGGVGTLAGFAMFSDENAKTKRRKARSALPQVRQMPVEEWEYKPGMGDGGGVPHTGTMAQDFKAATGKGDGRSIPVVDAIGTTMKAIQELDRKVTRIARGIPGMKRAA